MNRSSENLSAQSNLLVLLYISTHQFRQEKMNGSEFHIYHISLVESTGNHLDNFDFLASFLTDKNAIKWVIDKKC